VASTGSPCQAKNRHGERCGGFAVVGSRFCFWHNPGDADARKLARKKGGKARHGRVIGPVGEVAPVSLESIADVLALVAEAVNDVRRLENSIARARCIGYLAGIAGKALEMSELVKRIEALEARE